MVTNFATKFSLMFYKTETLFQLQIYFEKLTEYFAILWPRFWHY